MQDLPERRPQEDPPEPNVPRPDARGFRSISGGITRRAFLRLATGAAAGFALAACAPAPPEVSTQGGGKVKLVYQDWRTDWFPPMAQQALEEFHTTHPSISVYYTPDPDKLEDKMLADMQAGTAADVFQGCCTHFPIWAQKGYTVDLRPYVAADLDRSTIEDWDPAQYDSFFTRDGRQYGLPKYHGALALYYNKDLFDKYHVDYPDGSWDHSDYLTAMMRLTPARDRGGSAQSWGSMLDISWDRIQIHVNGWGGNFVDPKDPTRCLMGEQTALEALEWLRARMWDDRVMASLADVQLSPHQAFVAGLVAMVEDGSWALKDILAGADFRVGVAPFPAGPARRVTLATTDGFGIYSGTRHPEAAWELVRFLIGKDYGRAMARANFLQPARASLVEEWAGFIREEFPERSKGLDIAAFADGHLKRYSVTAEVFSNMADAKDLAYSAWDRILTLGQAPVDLMKDSSLLIQEAQKAGASGARACCG